MSFSYSPVTSINVVATVYEYCLLEKLNKFEIIDFLQMGFTSDGGCDNAEFIVRSVGDYFTNFGRNVYVST